MAIDNWAKKIFKSLYKDAVGNPETYSNGKIYYRSGLPSYKTLKDKEEFKQKRAKHFSLSKTEVLYAELSKR